MAEPLEIVITAKDDTARVLDTVRTKVTGFGQELERIDRGGGRTFDNLGGSVQNLAVRFTRVLDPALGSSVSRIAALGTSLGTTAGAAGSLATVIGTTVVAAVAVGGLGLNTYINTLSRLSQEQAKTNALLAEMDFGGLAGRAQGLNRQMLDLQATFSAWQAVKNVTVGALNEIGGALDKVAGGGISGFIRRFGTDTQAVSEARAARDQANAAIEQLVPGQRARLRTGVDVLGFQTGGALAGGRAQEALGRQDITTFLAEMDRRERELSNELTARERGIAEEFEPQFAVARASGAGPGRMALLQETMRSQQEALGRTTAFETLRRQRSAGAEAIGLALSGQVGDPNLSQVAPIAGTEADAALQARATAAALATLDIERQRADILGELTPQIEAQLALRQQDLLLSQAGLTEAERALVVGQTNITLLEQMVRLNPVAGLAAGFSEIANQTRELGTELRNFAHETAGAMNRAFSDQFFDLFTGKKGEDIGKRFGESLLRSFTDLLGRQLTGSISGLFANALGGVRGVVPGVAGAGAGSGGGGFLDLLGLAGQASGQILSPTGAPAGTLVMTQGGLVQVTATGALQAVGSGGGGFGGTDALGAVGQLNSLSGQFGGPTLGVAGAGGGYLAAVAATPLSAIAQFGFTTAVAQTQAGLALGFGASAGGTTFTVAGATAGAPLTNAGLSTVGATAGLSAASAATGVLAGIALGYTIYGGLTQEQTAQNIAINAVSGAISGAVLGAIIGSLAGPVGTVIGGAIGAIIGGAVAGGTTGIKAPKGLSVSDRSRKIGEVAASNLASAISSATSIEDLVAIFNTKWAPHGEVQILTTYLGVTYWAGDFDDPGGALATTELMIIPEFLDALVIQSGETGAPQFRQDLVDLFKNKRNELLGILSEIPIAILERDAAAGVSRRTYQPFQTIYGLKPGTKAVAGSSELYERDLGAEDETIAFLIQRIKEVSVRKDIDLSREDFLFR